MKKNGPKNALDPRWHIGLRYGQMDSFIIAKDPAHKRVLLGGLGCLGVGEMWCDGARYLDTKEYKDAPIKDSWMGFGTEESRSLVP